MAQRPESRAVKATRVPKARQPAGEAHAGAAVPATVGRKRAQSKASQDIPQTADTVQVPLAEMSPAERPPPRPRAGKPKASSPDVAKAAAAALAPSKRGTAKKPAVSEPAMAKRAGKDGSRAKSTRKPKRQPPYLAAELGQPVDQEGEPIGAGSPMARSDTELQEYTLQLWQQMQSRRGANQHIRAMEHAGLTVDDLWATGVTGRVSTSSTPDELRRYRQNLLFRANLLEAILMETVSELRRLESVEPTPPPAGGSS